MSSLKECNNCPLCKNRGQVVLGKGNLKADIMFIGEAPGKDEDRLGTPFVGAAGKKLDLFLNKVGLKRNEIYITNVVKCWPHIGNKTRTPFGNEIKACTKWLNMEVTKIKPKIIVLLGKTAMKPWLGSDRSVMDYAGHFIGNFFIMPHPASIIYERSREEKYFKCADILKEYLNGKERKTC